MQDERGVAPDGKKIYTLGDVYPHAIWLRIHPALKGLEMHFLKLYIISRPILVNNYSIYEVDIKPKGFRAVSFDGFMIKDTLEMVRHILKHPTQAQEWAEENYQLAKRHFSFTVLEHSLQSILADCLGQQI